MPDNEIGTSLLPVVTHRDAFIDRIEEMFAYPQKKEQPREAQADENIICPAVPASGRAITMADRTTTPPGAASRRPVFLSGVPSGNAPKRAIARLYLTLGERGRGAASPPIRGRSFASALEPCSAFPPFRLSPRRLNHCARNETTSRTFCGICGDRV